MDYLEERAEKFEQMHGVRIEILWGDANEARTQFLALTVTGIPVDVTDFWAALAGDYISRGFFEDLRPYALRDGLVLEELFQPQVLDALTFEGELFSMPLYINPRVTYYHRDKFSQAGLPDPVDMGDDWTWERMREAALRLTRERAGTGEPEQFGIASARGYNWMQFIHQAGGSLYDRVLFPTASRLNSEEVLIATEFAAQLIVEDRVTGGRFESGTAAMSLDASAQSRRLLDEGGFDWDIVLHAKGPYSRASMFGIGGLQLVSSSQEKDLAWEWIKFITLDEESVRRYVVTNLRIPPLRSVQPDFPNLATNLPRNWMALMDSVAQPNSFTLPVVTKNSQSVDAALNAMNAVWSGTMAPKTALEQIHEQINALWLIRTGGEGSIEEVGERRVGVCIRFPLGLGLNARRRGRANSSSGRGESPRESSVSW